MKYLLDTHIFIWWMLQSKKLDKNIYEIIENPQNEIFLSMVNIWEIVIKKKSGKLRVPKDWKETLQESNFSILSIKLEHVFAVEQLSLLHKDPFDRMLIAQATTENCVLITVDKKLKTYDIPTIGLKE